jgi:hypothetical protein
LLSGTYCPFAKKSLKYALHDRIVKDNFFATKGYGDFADFFNMWLMHDRQLSAKPFANWGVTIATPL